MIIHSTTLDTQGKVKAIYGGTTWIQHSGYVLRGATSGVISNSATKTDGSDDMIVPYHRHDIQEFKHAESTKADGGVTNGIASSGGHTHSIKTYNYGAKTVASGSNYTAVGAAGTQYNTGISVIDSGTGTHTHSTPNHIHTIKKHYTDYVGTTGNTTNANIPNYKSVYIWERTA